MRAKEFGMSSSRRQVATYFFFVFLFSSVFYLLILRAKSLERVDGRTPRCVAIKPTGGATLRRGWTT